MPLALSQHKLAEDARPPFSGGTKIGAMAKALLWTLLHEDPACPSRVLLDKVAQTPAPLPGSLRHRNRVRATWQLHRRKGRPRHAACSAAAGGALVQIPPHLSCVGVHLFAHGLDQQEALSPVVARRQQAIEAHTRAHPADDLALLHHRAQTLRRRCEALFFAPLCGIERLPAVDTHEHPLQTLRGRGYHSATLRQFLGQLERIDAAAALLPALVPDKAGQCTSVDGHMMASGSRASMHKGTITMLGRMMAGSQAVIAHDEAGQALFVASSPPDLPLSQGIVAYCQKGVEAPGPALVVIDRAVNAVAMARAFDAQGFGVLSMLDDHEPQGLESCEATQVGTLEEGTKVSRGPWHVPRPADPRHCVIVEPAEGKPLVYWGTPQVKDALAAPQWPQVYRERNERQENGFKRMIDHGALEINAGRNTIVGPDRHQQRAREQRDQSLVAAQQRLAKPAEALKTHQDKGAESEHTGQGTRLAQRQRALAVAEKARKDAQDHHETRAAHASALGPPRERADRDFRTQTIMTFRTRLLENALTSCMAGLVGTLTMQVSLDCLVHLLFARSGARMETDSHIISWMNTTGLSVAYQRLLTAVVDGLGAMDLRDQGKPIRVRLKGLSP